MAYRPQMSGPGQPGMNVVGHGRQPVGMIPGGATPYMQQPRPGMMPMMSSLPPQQQMTGYSPHMMPAQMQPQGYYVPQQGNIQMPRYPYPQQQIPAYTMHQNMPVNQMPILEQNLTEEQRKQLEQERKNRFFQEQKEKLKAFGQIGQVGLPTTNMASLEGMMSMFGKKNNKPAANNVIADNSIGQERKNVSSLSATMAEDDDFGDFKTGPTVVSNTSSHNSMLQQSFIAPVSGSPVQPSLPTVVSCSPAQPSLPTAVSDSSAQPSLPTAVSGSLVQPSLPTAVSGSLAQLSEDNMSETSSHASSQLSTSSKADDKKNLDSLMLEHITDMSSGQQKTKKTFHQKTALKDAPTVKKSQTTSTSFSESNKSRKWDNSEELSDMFVIPQPAPAVPAATEPSSTATGPPAVAPVPATTIITTADVHNTQLSTHSNTTISQPTSAANLASMPSTQSVFTPPKWCENEMNLPIVYRHVLEATLRNGRIETELLYPIFLFSGLEKQVLGHIWSLCNNTTPGMLTKQEAFMALALIAVAQSGQLQNVNLKTLYEMSQPPIPILMPSGGSTPSGDVTPVNKTPVEPTGSTEDDDFAPFKEAPMPVKGSPINIQPIISQPPPPPASSSFILPPPPLPAPSSQYTIPPCERELSSSPPPRDVLNASPTPSIDSLGSADLPDPIMDKFSTFQSASEDSSVPSESMYPPLSSEDEYADFKSADSDTSSSMSSSRASSRTSSSHNTDPELVGYPQSPVDPDFPTSASSSPASLKYQRSYKRSTTRSTTKSTMKLTKDSFTSAKISPPKNLKLNQPVQSVNLNPSKFGTVRECESDDFAEFKQAAHTRGTFSNAPSVIAPPGQPLTFPIKPPVQDEFADFQQAPLPTRQNSDLFKFNESADDKYAALRDLIAPQTNEPDDEFTDFQTGSCDQDEFADFKKVQPSSGFEESNEFSDFQGPKEPTSAIDEFSDFKGPTESDIVEDEFGQFKDAAKIDNIDEFGDFKQEALPPEEPLGFRGGMAGGFFQSDVVESETITLPPSDMFSAIKDLYNKDDAVITSKIQTNFKEEDKEETHNLFNREPPRVRAISMNDDDDDFFGRRPPGLPDFDDEDDEFNNYNTPPVVHDDLFTPVATDKPTNKPANKFDMFGGQEFTAKVDKSSEFSNANDVITLNNHETIGKKTLPDLATDDKFDAFKASTLSDDKYSVFRDLTPLDTTNKNKEIDTEQNSNCTLVTEKHEGSSTEENWKAVNEQKLKVLPPSGDEDDLFGNLGPEPPGYHGNINKDNNYGDFSTTSGSSRTLDSVSLNSKESDSISIDNVTMRKSLPKLDSLPSLDLKRFESDDDSDFGDFNTAATDTTSTNGIEITAKEDKSLDHRIGAMVLSTGPPPGPPPNLNQAATVPWLVADRYANIVGDIEDNERHTYEWQRCLQSCYDNVKKANDIFNSISCSSVCLQVTKSEEGSNYLQAVVEIYRVACRVRTSIKSSGFENAGILKLLKDIDLIWNNLAAFLAGSSFLPDDSYFVFKGAILKCDPENAPKACGVCLLSVDSRSKAFDKSKDNHKLTYGGRQYHSTCANLWVNLVDSILPSLPLPSLL